MRRFELLVLALIVGAGGLFGQVGVEAGAAGIGNAGIGAGVVGTGGGAGTAQKAGANQLVSSPQGNALLASTTADYPVTPGDTFSLTFLQSTQPATMRLFVDTDGGINAGVFGHIDAMGLTYPALKAKIEKLVSQGYPGSNPSFQIVATGLFTVKVDGEVTRAELKTAWGLTRLSEIVGASATAYADRRSVLVKDVKGTERHFDLFKASRDGDLSDDPYVRPGDMVVLAKAGRTVVLGGAVYRPGSYQLLAGEGIADLVKRYGDGLRDDAQPAFATLTRRASSESVKGESMVIDARLPKGSTIPALYDGDSVFIPTRESYLPVVYFEGAITTGDALAAQAAGNTKPTAANDSGGAAQVSARIYGQSRTTYKPGDLLSQAIRVIAPNIQPNADLRNAFIARKGQADTIPVDLEKLLYAYNEKDDVALQPEDRIVIPFGSLDIFVTGEVKKSSWVSSGALTRLSAAIGPFLTPYSSIRDVTVRSAGGEEKQYDLFKADRDGDLSNDPLVRPGDTVILAKAERTVSIGGAVYRPGAYQLMAGEGLVELLARYADGLRDEAQPAYASLSRRASKESKSGESIVFDASHPSAEKAPLLYDGDTVFIPTRESYLPVVYFEGAVTSGGEPAAKYGTNRQPYKPGDMLSRLVRAVAGNIQPNADLRHAFISRKGQGDTIPVDLEKLLYAYDAKDDVALQPEDRIVIPFGSLDIFVTGEVKKSSWVSSGALTRLSAAIGPFLTPYSSIRDVTVRSAGGEEKQYDLFKADRNGDLSNDPFLKPGDLVTVHRLLRSVTIGGEVKYPGTYQLLPGEELKDAIEYYAGGLTGRANPTRMTLGRDPKPGLPLGLVSYIDYSTEPDFVVRNLDNYSVPSVSELLPVVYFEGAIGVPAAAGAEGKPLDAANRIPHVFVPGEMLSQAVQSIRGGFTATSDLAHAYIIRDESRIGVNIADLIYKSDFTQDHALVANDTIIIPFRQYFITVAGAVRTPGRYPYVPDRSYQYYINLAGGYDFDKSTGKSLTIDSVAGIKKDLGKDLEPEDRIYVNDDNFIYNMGKVLAIVGNLATVISVAYTLYSLIPKH